MSGSDLVSAARFITLRESWQVDPVVECRFRRGGCTGAQGESSMLIFRNDRFVNSLDQMLLIFQFDGLFSTLSRSTEIAALVERLDVIYYPLASRNDWPTICNQALSNLKSLTSLTWTRDRSLGYEHLETLASLDRLTKLEINGNRLDLNQLTALQKLQDIREFKMHMPDSMMITALPGILKTWHDYGVPLESFEIITRVSLFTIKQARRNGTLASR
jgi:hypothetical protein